MNEIIETLAGGLLVWTLRSAAIGLGVLALLGALRKASASVRHLILLSGFVLIVAMPLYDVALSRLSSETEISWTLPPALPDESVVLSAKSVPADAVNLVEPVTKTQLSLAQIGRWSVLGIAAAGFVLFGLRVLIAQFRLSRLARSCAPANPQIQDLAQSIQDRPSCQVLIARDDQELSAMTWGTFPAKILLPHAAEEWSREKLTMVFRHELAHVRRRDAVTLCLAQWMKALQWWNPIVWVMTRQLEAECEHACDDLVVEQLGEDERGRYAHLVLSFANGSAGPAHLGMANVGNLETRLTRIASGSTIRTKVRWWAFGAAMMTALFAPIVFAFAQGVDAKTEERAFEGIPLKTVILDAGHGGPDTGAKFGDLKESELNLEITKFVQQLLKEYGIRVVMTREDDSLVSHAERSQIISKEEDAILISIHAGASPNFKKRGIDVFSPERAGLNQQMLTLVLADELGQIQEVPFGETKTAKFPIFRDCPHPAVYLDAGYLSNPEDNSALKESVFRLALAQRIAVAVRRLQGDVEARETEEIENRIRQAQIELKRLRERLRQSQEGREGNPADLWLKAFMIVREGEQFEKAGSNSKALAKFKEALAGFDEIVRTHPDWKPDMINFRRKMLNSKIEEHAAGSR